MPLKTVHAELYKAWEGGYALPLFDTYDMHSTEGMILALQSRSAPAIIGLYSSVLDRPNLRAFVAYIQTRAADLEVPVSLMLDHGASVQQCKLAVDLGFTDVMFDGSQLPLSENISATRQVVEYAHGLGVGVEAEIGHVGLGSEYRDRDTVRKGFTDPDTVERFVAETDVDYLAVAIGTAHGLYAGEPELNLDLLAAIRARVDIPLVLHGGTGLSQEQFHSAIDRGISKINVATDLYVTTGKRLSDAARTGDSSYFSLSRLMVESIHERCGYYLDLFGASGKAELEAAGLRSRLDRDS